MNRRRSSDGLAMGVSYTYEMMNKTLGTIDPFVDDNRARNYTQNGRRPHNVIINYSYEPPKFKRTTRWSRRSSTIGRSPGSRSS